MRRIISATWLILILAGCTTGEKKAAELLETARFEEKQHNLEHATKLYAEIILKHPDSASAREAGKRLSELKPKSP